MPEIAAFCDGKTGIAFKHGSSAALAEALAKCMSDYNRLDKMSEAAVAATRHDYNTDAMARRFTAAIQQISNTERIHKSQSNSFKRMTIAVN